MLNIRTGQNSQDVIQRDPVVFIEIMKSITDMHQSDDTHDYVLNSLATSVVGYRPHDSFTIWTGTAVNGKTLTKILAKATFGGYFNEPDAGMFCVRSVEEASVASLQS